LLAYLIRNQHWSPWEMVHAVVQIDTTRDIGRQVLRHKSFSFQEFSQRYAEVLFNPIVREARLQDAQNRQASIQTDDELLHELWEASQMRVWEAASDAYQKAIKLGIAKEVARAVLPEGMTPSRIYMAGSLRSWLHYLALRRGSGTQLEHVHLANDIVAALRPVFPHTVAVLDVTSGGTA
jgi:thymidylate synthase (FAD)